MPKISVIVPVYNTEPYLRQCIDSILNQTFTDFELLLVDDGSTDHSGEICEEYAQIDTRIRVFHTANQGVSAARNLGISKACAKWITFVDSDDWVDIDFLYSFDCKNLNDAGIIYQGILLESNNSKDIKIVQHSYTEATISPLTEKELEVYHILDDGYAYGKLYNSTIIQKNGIVFDIKLTIHEDLLFLFTYLCYIKEIRLSSSLTYHYRRQGKGANLSAKPHSAEEYLYIADKMQKCLSSLCFVLQINNIRYIKHLYTKHCLYKYLFACTNARKENYVYIYNSTIFQKELFRKYFIPQNLKHKIIWWLFSNKYFPFRCLYTFYNLRKKLFH